MQSKCPALSSSRGCSFLAQRGSRGWEFNLPKIIVAQKFKGQAYILVAAGEFPIDHPRPDVLAPLWVHHEQLVSNFQAMVTNDSATMFAKQGCFRRIVLNITTRWLPTQSDWYPSCNSPTSPGVSCEFHLSLNSRSARNPRFFSFTELPLSSYRYSLEGEGRQDRGGAWHDFDLCYSPLSMAQITLKRCR